MLILGAFGPGYLIWMTDKVAVEAVAGEREISSNGIW
jgi:hypothetical protein